MIRPNLIALGLFTALSVMAACRADDAIHSGVAWYDQNNHAVSAHGAGITREGDRYYLFGEFKQDHGNAFNGFSCYSSTDLINWKFESIVLPVQPDGLLGPDRVGERPKVMKCPKTGEFVMFMHTDNARYKDPAVGYATSPTINGTYTFRGPLLLNGKPVKKWDMGVFQDDDGTGYLITHSGSLYKLADDYQSVTAQIVKDMTPGCEAPALFKRNGLYYWLGSSLTGWERNDNTYFTAKSLSGPWEPRGIFAPKDTLTWNSQTTFVLPVVGSEATTWLFMGDRWAHPFQNSAATYVWQPLQFDADGKISLTELLPSWKIDTRAGRWSPAPLEGKIIPVAELVQPSAAWQPPDAKGFTDLRSNVKGATLTIPFTGSQIGLYGVARPDGGFGTVEIKDRDGKIVLRTVIETYCHYYEASLKFLSPKLPPGDYTLTFTVLGEHFYWTGKKASYGSTGDYVSVQKILLVENPPLSALPKNPILPDFHADPSARVFNGKLYVYPTHDVANMQHWDEVDWHVFSSNDLTKWEDHGVIFSLKDITWATKEAWAPDCIERNGKYYFYFPAGGQIGVAVGDSPTGPFKDALGKPLIKAKEAGIRYMIDPNAFIDDDGQAYLFVGGARQLGVVKLKADMITRDGPIQLLDMPKFYEGVWIHKRNGIYYASYPTRESQKTQAGVMVYSMAKSPLGPWEYKGAIIDNHSPNVHGSITEFKGRWYLFYHVAASPDKRERQTCMEPLFYNEDGTIQPIQMTPKAENSK